MDLKSLGQTVIRFGAPLLGTAVGGPAGTAIAQILASEFGGSLNNVDGLIKNIEMDPNAALKCYEIQSNNKIQLQQIAMQMAQISATDTADARKNNVEGKSIMPQIISFIILVMFFGCIWIVVAYKQDADDHDVLYMMFGTVSAAFGSMMQYWFGSSAGSRIKDITLARK